MTQEHRLAAIEAALCSLHHQKAVLTAQIITMRRESEQLRQLGQAWAGPIRLPSNILPFRRPPAPAVVPEQEDAWPGRGAAEAAGSRRLAQRYVLVCSHLVGLLLTLSACLVRAR